MIIATLATNHKNCPLKNTSSKSSSYVAWIFCHVSKPLPAEQVLILARKMMSSWQNAAGDPEYSCPSFFWKGVTRMINRNLRSARQHYPDSFIHGKFIHKSVQKLGWVSFGSEKVEVLFWKCLNRPRHQNWLHWWKRRRRR
jgi:hypothetical protein